MAGWEEHTFDALHRAAELQERLGRSIEQIISAYCKAYQFRPTRAEPLYHLAKYLNIKQHYVLSYSLLKQVFPLDVPKDLVYVEPLVYQYGIPFELGSAAQALGKLEEAETLFKQILAQENTPDYVQQAATLRLSRNTELKKLQKAS